MSAAQVDQDRRQRIGAECEAEAWRVGAKAAVTALGLAGAAVGGANYLFRGFRTSLGVSGKAALIVSTAQGACLRCMLYMLLQSRQWRGQILVCCRSLRHLQCSGSIPN